MATCSRDKGLVLKHITVSSAVCKKREIARASFYRFGRIDCIRSFHLHAADLQVSSARLRKSHRKLLQPNDEIWYVDSLFLMDASIQ
jgi:hypothetical protein